MLHKPVYAGVSVKAGGWQGLLGGVGRYFVVGGLMQRRIEVRCNYKSREARGDFYCGLLFFRCKNGSAASCSYWAYNRVVNCIYYTN